MAHILTTRSLSPSDLERYVHVFAVPSSKDPYLLCLTLLVLQQHDRKLPDLCLWLPKQHHSTGNLCRVSYIYMSSFTNPIQPFLFFSIEFVNQSFYLPFSCAFYRSDSPHLAPILSSTAKNNLVPLLQCTRHMCPIRVHWHVKLNYKEYWRVKITITNFNYRMNYSQWNLVVQHPNFDNLTQIFSFNYEPITPYESISKLKKRLRIKICIVCVCVCVVF